MSKLKDLLSSMRFWQITLAAAAFVWAHPDQTANTVATWLAAIAAIGTVDKAAKAKGQASVSITGVTTRGQ